ncbi:MAG TPA: hypothetical protein VL220_01415 [Steroidobacteraceae bacterium]|nr:hypothetical protein [Steroidobacteraceae bacterium]
MGKLRYRGVMFIGCVGFLVLGACGREGQDEMSWARGALERNKSIEVVAADQQSRTFTVRVKDGGELRTVHADEVIGSPAGASAGTAAHPLNDRTASPSAASEAAPVEQPVVQAQSAGDAEPAADAETPVTHSQSVLTSESSAGLEHVTPGRVLESGPGYSITSAQAAMPGAARMRDSASSAPLERRHEPIVCQGSRLLHIDNRNLIFDGDAVSAMDGCEIHITNSHISASGVGIAVRGANVHIDNSQIEGDQASIEASQGAQVYAASSRFKGLSRRLDTAAVHDLGGNTWN